MVENTLIIGDSHIHHLSKVLISVLHGYSDFLYFNNKDVDLSKTIFNPGFSYYIDENMHYESHDFEINKRHKSETIIDLRINVNNSNLLNLSKHCHTMHSFDPKWIDIQKFNSEEWEIYFALGFGDINLMYKHPDYKGTIEVYFEKIINNFSNPNKTIVIPFRYFSKDPNLFSEFRHEDYDKFTQYLMDRCKHYNIKYANIFSDEITLNPENYRDDHHLKPYIYFDAYFPYIKDILKLKQRDPNDQILQRYLNLE